MNRKYASDVERILRNVVIDEIGCWVWQLRTDKDGYGCVGIRDGDRRRCVRAHRLSYQTFVGPIPEGLTLDHLCRVPACANPAHLEPVTNRINILRGTSLVAVNAAKTQCKYGHAFDEVNTYVAANGNRQCRTCRRLAYHTRRRAALAA